MANTQPGPIDGSLLRFQDNHVSNLIWKGQERLLHPRCHAINQVGFGRVMAIGQVEFNSHLISALVERWRIETHTFHFPYGEATITLQDVVLQLGLEIDGVAVTRLSLCDVREACQVLLGVTPPDKYIKGKTVYLTWLCQLVQNLSVDADEFVINQLARAHIVMLIGGCLMPDTSEARLHFMYLLLLANLTKTTDYSWGAAVLASLFRSLDRVVKPSQIEIGGCLLLLQSWACYLIRCLPPHILPLSDKEIQQGLRFPLARRWSRPMAQTNISTNSVTLIREIFDRLQINKFLWTPYDTADIRPLINNVDIPMIVRARVPLICYAIVEWHPVDRVMRQFGMRQNIPNDPSNLDELHNIEMRGRTYIFWPYHHRRWIRAYNDWNDFIVV